MLLRAILLLAPILTCGCTTMRTVAPGELQAALDSLQKGDHVAVRIADRWHENLIVHSVTDSSVQAENPGGERVTFDRLEVAEVRVRVSAPGKTAGLAVGILFGVLGSGIPGLSL